MSQMNESPVGGKGGGVLPVSTVAEVARERASVTWRAHGAKTEASYARRITAMVLRSERPDLSLPDIARAIGLTSHASVHRMMDSGPVARQDAESVAVEALRRFRYRQGHKLPKAVYGNPPASGGVVDIGLYLNALLVEAHRLLVTVETTVPCSTRPMRWSDDRIIRMICEVAERARLAIVAGRAS